MRPTSIFARAKRLRFGEEEQRNECALTFEKSRSKRYAACSDVSCVDKKIQFYSDSKERIHHILINPLIKQRKSSDISL